jgi:hypothetical protein
MYARQGATEVGGKGTVGCRQRFALRGAQRPQTGSLGWDATVDSPATRARCARDVGHRATHASIKLANSLPQHAACEDGHQGNPDAAHNTCKRRHGCNQNGWLAARKQGRNRHAVHSVFEKWWQGADVGIFQAPVSRQVTLSMHLCLSLFRCLCVVVTWADVRAGGCWRRDLHRPRLVCSEVQQG